MNGPGGTRIVSDGNHGMTTHLSEWEAQEALRGKPDEAAALLGVHTRTIYRYRKRRYRCHHCGMTFITRPAAWDHLIGADS